MFNDRTAVLTITSHSRPSTAIATLLVHVAAIIMTAIMLVHVRSKYTAVGRKEMCLFFYLYALLELLGIFTDTGIIPFSSPVFPVSAVKNAHQHI
jgi:hypothetical protein